MSLPADPLSPAPVLPRGVPPSPRQAIAVLRQAIEGAGHALASGYRKLSAIDPALADPVKSAASQSPALALAATRALGDFIGSRDAALARSVREGTGKEAVAALERAVAAGGEPIVRQALSSAFATSLWHDLGEAHRALVLLGGLAAAGAALVKKSDESTYDVSIPGVGSFTLDKDRLRSAAAGGSIPVGKGARGRATTLDLAASTADPGLRQQEIAARAGITVPVARRSELSTSLSARSRLDASKEGTVSARYKTPLSPSSAATLDLEASQSAVVDRGGHWAPGETRATASVTAPIYDSRTQRDREREKLAVEALKDRVAMDLIRRGYKDPATGLVPTYSQLMQLGITTLQERQATLAQRDATT